MEEEYVISHTVTDESLQSKPIINNNQDDEAFFAMTPEECNQFLGDILSLNRSGALSRDKVAFLRANVAKAIKASNDATHDHTSFFQSNRVVPSLVNNVVHLSLSNPPLETHNHEELLELDLESDEEESVDYGLDFDDEEDFEDEVKIFAEQKDEEVDISYLRAGKCTESVASRSICYNVVQSFYVEKKGILEEATVDRIEDATSDYYRLPASKEIKHFFDRDIKNGISLAELRTKIFSLSSEEITKLLLFIDYPKMKVKMLSGEVKTICDYGDQPLIAAVIPPTTNNIDLLAKDIMRISTYVTGSNKLFANTARCYITGLRISDAYYKAYMKLMDVEVPIGVSLVNVYRGGLLFCKALMRKYPERKMVVVNVSDNMAVVNPAFTSSGRKITSISSSVVVSCEALEFSGKVLYLDVGAPIDNNYTTKKRDRAMFIRKALSSLSERAKSYAGGKKLFQTYVSIYHVLGKLKAHPSVFGASGISIYRTYQSGIPTLKLLSLMLAMSRYCVTYPYYLVPRLEFSAKYKGVKFTHQFKFPAVCDFRLTESERIELTGGGSYDFGDTTITGNDVEEESFF